MRARRVSWRPTWIAAAISILGLMLMVLWVARGWLLLAALGLGCWRYLWRQLGGRPIRRGGHHLFERLVAFAEVIALALIYRNTRPLKPGQRPRSLAPRSTTRKASSQLEPGDTLPF